jgi:hypothetical protein
MTDLTDEKWQRLRVHFGDLAYEHPEMHSKMLDLLHASDLDAALEKQQMRGASASPRVWPSASRSSGLARDGGVSVEAPIATARAILNRHAARY